MRVVRVVLVEERAALAVDAVGRHQRRPGDQHPGQLGEDAVLGLGRLNVMEHVEGGRTAEAVRRESSAVASPTHHLHVAAGHPFGQARRQALVELDRREVRRLGAQDVGREPGPGPISMASSPRSTSSSATGRIVSCTSRRQSSLAQYSMWPGFMGDAQPGAWTWYSSFHQRAVRTSSGSVRSEGSCPRSSGVGPIRSATGRSASRSKS